MFFLPRPLQLRQTKQGNGRVLIRQGRTAGYLLLLFFLIYFVKILLCVTSDLGAGSGSHKALDSLPVPAIHLDTFEEQLVFLGLPPPSVQLGSWFRGERT